jgi:hypothetical protein
MLGLLRRQAKDVRDDWPVQHSVPPWPRLADPR